MKLCISVDNKWNIAVFSSTPTHCRNVSFDTKIEICLLCFTNHFKGSFQKTALPWKTLTKDSDWFQEKVDQLFPSKSHSSDLLRWNQSVLLLRVRLVFVLWPSVTADDTKLFATDGEEKLVCWWWQSRDIRRRKIVIF